MSGPGLETAAIMEALVLNWAGLDPGLLLNSIWTWVAVMTTAALGLWRFRSHKPVLGPKQPDPKPNHLRNVIKDPVRVAEERTAPETDRTPSTSNRAEECMSLERGGVTKGNNIKYTEYCRYTMHGDQEISREDGGVGWVDGGDGAVVKEWRCRSSSSVAEGMGMGMGWYSHQDLRVLDGSVVRLWDHARVLGSRRRLPVGVTRSLSSVL